MLIRLAVPWLLGIAVLSQAPAQTLSDVFSSGRSLRIPAERRQIVEEMRIIEQARKSRSGLEAARRGLAVRRILPNGRLMELVDWDNGEPRYLSTNNVSAAISTGANLLQAAPYSLAGSGIQIGVWDGGSVLAGHVEFAGRLTIGDGSAAIDHATHVAGTIAAAGQNSAARGMAPSATILSYDWNSDSSEMTANGAVSPDDPGKILLSNHSYGYIGGWNYLGGATRWEWTGSTTTNLENDFGTYNSYSRDADTLALNAPYYLIFRSAGNDRTDNPTNGETVALTPGGAPVTYSSATHPAGDGTYRGGFDTIGFNALAKNVITIGSAADAVSSGLRNAAAAGVSSFSSWGPTDDGRIKPDVVANGEFVFSSLSGSTTSYGSFSGTSMSSPNACGSAGLLIELYRRLYPGQAMRASTLKGLLLHTADDLGQPGPDYKYGWGLLDVQAAADLIQGGYDQPARPVLIENQLSSTLLSRQHTFAWDGISPIRATVCWMDPAGTATTTSDSRTSRLVNNLNLRLISPSGTVHRPFVMPFVGTWTQASMDLPATTGINNTDNIEQVFVAGPATAGTWVAEVSVPATPVGTQHYSLILSGSAASGPSLESITPASATAGPVTFTLSGTNLLAGATVDFTLAGQPDVRAGITSVSPTAITGTLDLTGMISGFWNVVVTNPGGQSATLTSGFAVTVTPWSRNFDSAYSGWTASASTGTSNWAPVTSVSHTPSTSWFATGPATKNTDNLTSEPIPIPANVSSLKLGFHHRFNLNSGTDGGVLEFSINNGSWFYVGNSGAAEAITTGGYNVTMTVPTGSAGNRNEFAGNLAWSGNSGSTFTPVAVSLKDAAKYAGKSLRARWRLGTNNSSASLGGWAIDSITLTGIASPPNQGPVITIAATAAAAPVTGLTTGLSVTATDDGGAAGLDYTWSVIGGTFERPVTFSENGNAAARVTNATFSMAGEYLFEVSVRDAAGATARSSVPVTVNQTPSSLTVSPAAVTLVFGATQLFTATLHDQFGEVATTTPAPTWSSSGGGTADSSGLFTPDTVGGPHTVNASCGGVSGIASISITPAAASIAFFSLTAVYDGTAKPVGFTTIPPGLTAAITYNNSAEAPYDFGTYAIAGEITDPRYRGTGAASLTIGGIALAGWRSQHFTPEALAVGEGDDDGDPDKDGLTNLAEYALGTNPKLPSESVVSHLDDTGLWLTFERPKALPDVIYHAETSQNLADWNPLPMTVVSDGPVQTIKVCNPAAITDRLGFLKVRFTRP